MPRGYGDLFPAGKRNQSRGVVLSTRAAQEECHYPVFLGDSEEATLQLADYLFPCPPVCVNPPGSKLSLGLAASIAGKQLHWNMRRSRRVPWELSQSSRILSAHVLKQHHCYGDLSNLGSKSYHELVADIADKQRRESMRQAKIRSYLPWHQTLSHSQQKWSPQKCPKRFWILKIQRFYLGQG